MATAALFIDNSNFYHSLKDSRRLPFPPSDYNKLFTELKKLKFDLKLIILYDAIKDIKIEPQQYTGQQKFHQGIKNLSQQWPIQIKTRKLKYRTISKGNRYPEEKGIDVLLAVDAIKTALNKKVENIVILSGDADFVPAVQFIEDELKVKVINLHLYQGSSTELREACKEHILISFNDGDIVLKSDA